MAVAHDALSIDYVGLWCTVDPQIEANHTLWVFYDKFVWVAKSREPRESFTVVILIVETYDLDTLLR
jgi:hypothetical protein